jgi:hypothetical protein
MTTNFIDYKAIVGTLISNLRNERAIMRLSDIAFIREYRTIVLGMPRQTGKTKFLMEHAKEKSALVIVHNEDMVQRYREAGVPAFNIYSMNKCFIGARSPYGLKFQCILVDECFHITTFNDLFFDLLIQLRNCNMITEDLYVLKLGTP